ncbi:DNA repair protein REV1 [Ceratobasidium sp. AG-Ba]|nr:DNA repair protein REV1 [Ceratobasidium sp. AG-Ba]
MDASPGQTDSLLKRLSGPSSGKAGLAKDQAEINKIIADVSKGSKFYENEKRKDAELTIRIGKLLILRDELMKSARIADIERLVDKQVFDLSHHDQDGTELAQIEELEAQRDLSQIICHADMDAFYATVETLDNPSLTGTAFGVGSGVLCTASYEARKFGVRSGMATFVAKALCPHLNIIPLRFHRYSEMSNRIFGVLRKYDPNLLAAGCDEGYLNLTAACQEANEKPEVLVQRMRDEVHRETGMTVSCGIAPNKALAKICSDLNKPNGQYIMSFDRDSIMDFTRNLPMRKMPGTGRVFERILDSLGVKTCGDIYAHRAQLYLLSQHNKLSLHSLLCAYLGVHNNEVAPHSRESRRSIGYERTFNPQRDPKVLLETLEKVVEGLVEDCEKRGWAGKTLTLKYKLDTYQSFTRAKSLAKWTMKKEDILPHARELLLKEFPLSLRLMGLRLSNLKDLRESANSGLKRFWNPAGSSKSEHNEHLEDEVTDSEDELGLWEVDPQGEPLTSACQTASKPMPPNLPTAALTPVDGNLKKGPTLKQSKLPVSRGSVPLARPGPSKRKRSASVGTTPSIIELDGSSRHTGGRRSLTTSNPVVIDLDLVCPNCLQEIDSDEQRLHVCSRTRRDSRTKPLSPQPNKKMKLAPLFCRTRP